MTQRSRSRRIWQGDAVRLPCTVTIVDPEAGGGRFIAKIAAVQSLFLEQFLMYICEVCKVILTWLSAISFSNTDASMIDGVSYNAPLVPRSLRMMLIQFTQRQLPFSLPVHDASLCFAVLYNIDTTKHTHHHQACHHPRSSPHHH